MEIYHYYHKKLLKPFETLCRVHDKVIVFDAFLDYLLWSYEEEPSILSLKKIVFRLRHDRRVDLLHEMKKVMLEFQQKWPFRDLLCYFYTMECANKNVGQYFTPDEIGDLISMISIPDIDSLKLGATVLDPACGSGSLLMATARRNPNLLFFGADLSDRCCKMALYNLISNGLSGEICHLNTLSNEFFGCYIIVLGKTPLGGKRLVFLRSADKNDSIIHLKTPDEHRLAVGVRKTKFSKYSVNAASV